MVCFYTDYEKGKIAFKLQFARLDLWSGYLLIHKSEKIVVWLVFKLQKIRQNYI